MLLGLKPSSKIRNVLGVPPLASPPKEHRRRDYSTLSKNSREKEIRKKIAIPQLRNALQVNENETITILVGDEETKSETLLADSKLSCMYFLLRKMSKRSYTEFRKGSSIFKVRLEPYKKMLNSLLHL